ncbi:PREDICTED: uncharacterized protein LOC103594502 [Galeopterus variegatus]|uniref:Uncharacterized protein LOC103594502 n=1 Tax=Galeopterus variegatus TaxID=482537 RepID=A0ABM0R5Q8_GALVR|nr:PREDICTED: uncharacterized protein LOC103594502 [Galeopterus variegatus]
MLVKEKDVRRKDGCGFQNVEKPSKKIDVTLMYFSVKETGKTSVFGSVIDRWCSDLLLHGKKIFHEDGENSYEHKFKKWATVELDGTVKVPINRFNSRMTFVPVSLAQGLGVLTHPGCWNLPPEAGTIALVRKMISDCQIHATWVGLSAPTEKQAPRWDEACQTFIAGNVCDRVMVAGDAGSLLASPLEAVVSAVITNVADSWKNGITCPLKAAFPSIAYTLRQYLFWSTCLGSVWPSLQTIFVGESRVLEIQLEATWQLALGREHSTERRDDPTLAEVRGLERAARKGPATGPRTAWAAASRDLSVFICPFFPPLLPLTSRPKTGPAPLRGSFGYPGGGKPSADREAAAPGRDAPHFLLQLPSPPPPPPPPRRPPLPASVVLCSGGEKCYVRKVPGGTGWGHAPGALLQAPARCPLYEANGFLWEMELFVHFPECVSKPVSGT